MSFFGRGGQQPPPNQSGQYNRIPDNQSSGQRQPAQPSQYRPQPPQQQRGYDQGFGNSSYEKRGYDRASQQRGGGGNIFTVVAGVSEAHAYTKSLIVNSNDFRNGEHVLVKNRFAITVRHDDTGRVAPGTISVDGAHRQWMELSLSGDQVPVEPLPFTPTYLESIDVEISLFRKNDATEISADDLTKHFVRIYNGVMFGLGESFVFEYRGFNYRGNVKGMMGVQLAAEQLRGAGGGRDDMGVMMEKTDVAFIKGEGGGLKLKSSGKKAAPNAILAPNFKFEDMGIGGLDTEFGAIFRRAFASRVFPPGLVDKLGIQHVKGILLHGPPGTGKTLMARQIGKMLNAREPKVVNGPEILNKFVGASEENIRKLFADAEAEYKSKGDESGLHIIIFDELDAICKQRGSTGGGTGVGDSVVNQLLSKMDGVDQLNNVLIIGMTNRLDMIDEALLRPGRLEVHMEISLPDEHGRFQILTIHTAKMRNNGVMDSDVNLKELAAITKNFSGAEIGGLIKSATSFAFNRHVKVGTMAGISDDVENLRVNRDDFISAFGEVQPAFGVAEEELQQVIQNGIIHFAPHVDELLNTGKLFVEQVRTSTRTPLVSILLHGPPGSGKTALAASIASASEYPFIKLLSPETMVGFSEPQKVAAINKVFADSYKSPLSVIVVDNLERLLDWTPIGPRFSNSVLQALLVLFGRRPPKGRRLLIIATSSSHAVLTDLGLSEHFDSELRVPPVSTIESLKYVITEVELFNNPAETTNAAAEIQKAGFGRDDGRSPVLNIGVKKLLSLIEMARQEPHAVTERLVSALMGLGM